MNKYGLNSEYKKLLTVLLYKPGPEIENYPDPAKIMHNAKICHKDISSEFDAVLKTYKMFGINVILVDDTPLSEDRFYQYNMMYCRDLLFMTPEGAIIANMANSIRREEILYAERILKKNDIPVIHKIYGNARFEGADALWVNEKLVIVGVGSRTDNIAYKQIKSVLAKMNVKCLALPSYQTKTQHILGTVQFVDKDLALLRYEITDNKVIRFLEKNNFTVVMIPENEEVTKKQAMNIVTIAPRTVIMTADCPQTKKLFANAGISVAAEFDITQVIRGAGGLACATGILEREQA